MVPYKQYIDNDPIHPSKIKNKSNSDGLVYSKARCHTLIVVHGLQTVHTYDTLITFEIQLDIHLTNVHKIHFECKI